MGCVRAFIQHLVCLLAFLTWLLGSIIIAYALWILSTTSIAKELFNGSYPVTYVCLCLGVLFFTNGLMGWMGSYGKGGLMLKMFLFLSILIIAAEIGGIITLSVFKTRFEDIVSTGWNETNDKSRSLIQEHFECCGFHGPKEYAFVDKKIDPSCYRAINRTELEMRMKESNSAMDVRGKTLRILNEFGCKDKLLDWIYEHRIIWIATFGAFLLVQVITVLLTVSAVNRKGIRSSSMESLDDPQTTYM